MDKNELKNNLLLASTVFGLVAARTKTKLDDKLVVLLQVLAESELLDVVYDLLEEWNGQDKEELIVGVKKKLGLS